MSLSTAITVARVSIGLIPVAIDAVKAVEQALPESGAGAQKLAMVRSVLEGAFATIEGITVTFEQIWPPINAVITGVVSVFNKSGGFKK